MNTPQARPVPQSADVVVIGGGQSGLALGYHLAQRSVDFVILDAEDRVGDAWRNRWDSLHLFTPAKYDGLPGLRFPGDGLAFPSKDQVADYLEAYATHFDLPVHLGLRAERVRREGDGFAVLGEGVELRARNVVLATGTAQAPRVPAFADRLAPDVLQLHSSTYRNPRQLKPGVTLVVGLGNSGAEIALDVSRAGPVIVAGRPSGEIPVGTTRFAARFVLPLVRFAGLHVLTRATPWGRKALSSIRTTPLIRTKLADLTTAGVRQVPRITGVGDGRPVTEEGEALEVANVIWCTGYRDDFGLLDVPGLGRDRPDHHRGVVTAVPGLYLLGQEFLYREASGTLPGVERDALYLARRMAHSRSSDQPVLVGVGGGGGA